MAVAQWRNIRLFLHAQAQALLVTKLGVPYRRKERIVAGAGSEELGEEQKQAGFVFDALDSDGDHRITREEYNAGFDAMDLDRNGKLSREEYNCDKMFSILDKDGDGQLSREEYQAGFDMIDEDKDGYIRRLEFIAAVGRPDTPDAGAAPCKKIDTAAHARTRTRARPTHARCGQPAMTTRMPNEAESKVDVTECSGVSSLLLGENQEVEDNRQTDGRRGVRFDSPREGDSPPVRATVAGSPRKGATG